MFGISIPLIRIQIQHFRLNINPEQWPKIGKVTDEKKNISFWKKKLQSTRPSSRRSLQSSKENIQHFKTWNFYIFSTFEGHFCPPGSGSGSADLTESGSEVQVLSVMNLMLFLKERLVVRQETVPLLLGLLHVVVLRLLAPLQQLQLLLQTKYCGRPNTVRSDY